MTKELSKIQKKKKTTTKSVEKKKDSISVVDLLFQKKSGIKTIDKNEKKTYFLPIIPLRDIVVYPNTISPLFIGREKSILSVTSAMQGDRKLFLVAQKNGFSNDIGANNLYDIGVVATIIQSIKLPDNTFKLLIDAQFRASVISYQDSKDGIFAKVKKLNIEDSDDNETIALMRQIINVLSDYAKLNKKIDESTMSYIEDIKDGHLFCDTILSYLPMDNKVKQEMLSVLVLKNRLEVLHTYMLNEINILQAEKTVQDRVKEQIDKNHKEYYLHEQIKAIKKELGEKDNNIEAVEKYERLLKLLRLSKEAYVKADEEIRRLSTISTSSSEHIRSYLDWLFAVPWSVVDNKKSVTISNAEKLLNTTHYGLDKVKEIILEYIAVQMNTTKTKGAILCLYGPPGVGKTSLVKTIAKAMGRRYVKIALGGVRDEAEIRGHRRTYIGALPGKIIQAMKKAGTSDPIVLLDEIDKLNSDHRGDPSSALLEALDPEQNNEFNDHYLEVGYDLSNVMFIATANSLNMQRPLLDRLEIIKVPSYLEYEKVEICKRHIVKKQLELIGLPIDSVIFQDDSIRYMINHYTRESGLREIERLIAKVLRKTLIQMMKLKQIEKSANVIIEKEESSANSIKSLQTTKIDPAVLCEDFKQIEITVDSVKKHLGIEKYIDDSANKKNLIGIVNGLAYTEVGGDVLKIESVKTPSLSGGIKITGKLGDVMKESVEAAFSHVTANYVLYGIKIEDLKRNNIHIHVPDGATPKDGPSAGIALATSIISLLTGVPVHYDVAMTGEITLAGNVLPIGGLREKLTAAVKNGIKKVCIPIENKKDLEEIPTYVKKACKIILCAKMQDVLDIALTQKIKPLSDKEVQKMLKDYYDKKNA